MSAPFCIAMVFGIGVGCTGEPSTSVRTVTVCPIAAEYPPAFARRLAGELQGAGPATRQYVTDGRNLRRQVAACRDRQRPPAAAR